MLNTLKMKVISAISQLLTIDCQFMLVICVGISDTVITQNLGLENHCEIL